MESVLQVQMSETHFISHMPSLSPMKRKILLLWAFNKFNVLIYNGLYNL